MTDPRDRIDTWLTTEVEPLAPPPGTFERIRRRARRRKANRALMSAAGVLVVIAAAVVAPRVAGTLLQGGGQAGPAAAAGAAPPSAQPRPTGQGNGSLNAKSGTKVTPPTSALSPGGSGQPVPGNFQPTSVTFIGPHLGAAIGQASTPGHCATAYCTSLAGTSDYGASWYGVSAPLTGPPAGALGVSQLRFLDAHDGWAFGPQLWVTHDGGGHWTQEQTYGLRVTDLETAGDRAFAVFATCTGTGPGYAADCTSFSLYSAPASGGQWQPVPGPVANLQAASGGQAAAASLVLTGGPGGGTGYLLSPSGALLSGPLNGKPWSLVSRAAPCAPGAPGTAGQPTGALLAGDSGRLILACTSATSTAGDTQTKTVTESTNGGVSWSGGGTAPPAGLAAAVSVQGQVVVLATDAGLYLSGNGGGSWRLTQGSPAGAAAGSPGFSYVGMTSPADGVALPADPGLHEVFITTDGGSTWRPRLISSP
jgi:hypothetical protein